MSGRVLDGVADLAGGALLDACLRDELSIVLRHLLKADVSDAAFGVAKLDKLANA